MSANEPEPTPGALGCAGLRARPPRPQGAPPVQPPAGVGGAFSLCPTDLCRPELPAPVRRGLLWLSADCLPAKPETPWGAWLLLPTWAEYITVNAY